jgi:energy-coupling factor transporter ATP-binding protein EcfA2
MHLLRFEESQMTITGLELRDFGAFKSASLELVKGVNVLVGANATGKTHVMKLLYSVLRSIPKNGSALPFVQRLREKMAQVFRPDEGQVGRLVLRRQGQGSARVRVRMTRGEVLFSIYTKNSSVRLLKGGPEVAPKALFLPSRELLAMYEGFIAAYKARELSFDETYYDGIVALSAGALKGPKPGGISKVLGELNRHLGGRVVRYGDRFYLVSPDGRLEAHLLAEGMRKLASVAHLLSNGALPEKGVLFWDEPEANLNPVLVAAIADMLIKLAAAGMQVVVASHDYLLTHTLALNADEAANGTDATPIRFFGFVRDAAGVSVTAADDLAALPENLIRDAFLEHIDRARRAAEKRMVRGSA